ncbi:MAG: glycine cleavage system protein GcvH [Thermoprotei archaeon]|nr:MAG: glycine cleavage system protein GcvH [Thermoprotei archaeon]RLE69502.1 MAG: glycine cleavage system protein GcvH [Thermoprotei archaeon]
MNNVINVNDYTVLKDLLYTKQHEWVRVEDDTVTIGISDFAQKKLKEVVYVELPEVGREVGKDESIASVESVKSVEDIYAPVSGKIVEVNETLIDAPEKVNEDPYGEGWMFKIKLSDRNELNDLLKPEEYAEFIKKEG